jgi:hypothetical protein
MTSAVVNRACASAKTSTGNGIAILIIQALDLLRAVMADVLAEQAKLAGAIAQ